MQFNLLSIDRWCFLLSLSLLLLPTVHARTDPWSESYRLEAEGKYAEASAAMEKVYAVRPINEFAVLRHAWLHYLLKQYNDAMREYKHALELNPNSIDARLGLTLTLLAQERWGDAEQYARQVIETSPWHYQANLRLMASEEGAKQWKQLALHARQLATYYPSDATIMVYLARAEARLGNVERALVAYRQVLERVPGHLEATSFVANNSK